LSVSEPTAVFEKQLEDQRVTEIPSEATFDCLLAEENAKVEWFKNDRPIKKGDKYDIIVSGHVQKLVVKDVEGKDEGEYSVVFKNKTSSAKLIVEGNCNYICEFYKNDNSSDKYNEAKYRCLFSKFIF
ncbi:hypothetical protein HELRODRAFT_78458, partial [Helobdella robusta]|uniref:Ig-like domain-containing protein n=1 Tax=Helobdella robusta TaxID=6412 RepID=T1G3C1_HELRO